MNNWKKYKLTDLGTLARGKSKNRPRDAAFLYGGPYPFIQTGDIKGSNHRIYSYTQTYSEAGLKQSKLWPKDTICLTIAANIGDTAILDFPACFPDSVLGFIADKTKCDVEFIEYLLQHYKKEIQSHSIGSVQDNINLGTFENVEFNLPTLSEQQTIAEILSSLDDKIELNLQINKTLEEMANALYKHWFVDFGPFQDGKFVESELGLIPEGWEVKTLEYIADFKNGKGIKDEDKHENGKYIVLGSNGIVGRTDKVLFKEPVIATGRVGANYGAIHYSLLPCWISDNAITSQPIIKTNLWFLLRLLQNINYNNFAVGSAQPLITQGAIKNILFAYPNQNILDNYYSKVNNLYLSINENKIECENLKQIRDCLLPKLISGEIGVKDPAKKVKEVL